MNIRKMKSEDVFLVDEIERECFSCPWIPEDFQSSLNCSDRYFTVLEEEGKIAGYACMWCVLDEGQIMNIAVSGEYRRRGFGAALLKDLIVEGANRGMRVFTLEVRESNYPARNLYDNFGFVKVGVRRGYYDCPKEDAILMDLELAPEEESY